MKYAVYLESRKYYYNGDGIIHKWTFNKNEAVKYACKKDAEKIISDLNQFYLNSGIRLADIGMSLRVKGIRSKLVQKEFQWD